MSTKWTAKDEDPARLPEGMKRVGYDADTSRYTFKDRKGTLYVGESGSEYGHLKPVEDPTKKVERERPQAFNDLEGNERLIPHSPRMPGEAAPMSFHDMIPSNMITSPTTLPDEKPQSSTFSGFSALVSPTNARQGGPSDGITSPTAAKFSDAFRSLKRSVTSVTKKNKEGRGRASSSVAGRASLDSTAKEKEPLL